MVKETIDLTVGMNPKVREQLEHQQYYIAGNHSAVKICHWTKKDLFGEGSCYKNTFYGITSAQCLQVSPAVMWCTERCLFCWRGSGYAGGDSMDNVELDAPDWLIHEMIRGQQKLLSGYGGNSKVDHEYWEQAQHPKHVAISLSGEPTLYPHLDEFIGVCNDLGMTTFLVTNGTQPEVLANLENLPTQLYLTAAAPTAEIHESLLRPFHPKQAWEKFNETIGVMADLDTRKVIRMTLVKDKNITAPEKYADIFFRAKAHFLEAKGYVSVGEAQYTFGKEFMPTIDDMRNFAQQIIDITPRHLEIIAEHPSSAAVLIAPEDYSWRKLKV